MKSENNRLEDVRITRPCPASWDAMEGGDKGRHCESCNLQVHNLAAMSRVEGESLLAAREPAARLCVRMELHPDGSPVTTDNPMPSPTKKPKPGNRVAAALALGAGLLAACTGDKTRPDRIQENANLSVDEATEQNVLQGSLIGEDMRGHASDESSVNDVTAREQLMMLGYVGPSEDCESAEEGADGASNAEDPWNSRIETKGEAAPNRVILGSPRAPDHER